MSGTGRRDVPVSSDFYLTVDQTSIYHIIYNISYYTVAEVYMRLT